ncbi:hypothetical protein ASE16_02160 [Leifsonia sp. Root227]|uniref:TolB family protein n=1 Tax=Leifsonia sp. Root227 TaxID=1736496 RepID=UPI0006FE7320|nr:PD40 domain-containing protein [Leifsonia sp. Root227]KRC51897.1 hypothetical protein ASE16_02160 [Leifsonia sp. Root227]
MSSSGEWVSQVRILDVVTGRDEVVLESGRQLEAPNWSMDGESLILNADGSLLLLHIATGILEDLPRAGVPRVNNDHVIAPDGRTLYVSTEAGSIHAIDLAQTGSSRAVTQAAAPDARRYLHGVSPDGRTLVYVLLVERASRVSTRIATMSVDGGPETVLTGDDGGRDDGPEFSPDGRWILFNSERSTPGQAQLYRMPAAGGPAEQLTFDDRVNWFPHPAPDGSGVLYLSYPPGTAGHPADRDVALRLLKADGSVRELLRLRGGQGTINVPSWHPNGHRFAFVAFG